MLEKWLIPCSTFSEVPCVLTWPVDHTGDKTPYFLTALLIWFTFFVLFWSSPSEFSPYFEESASSWYSSFRSSIDSSLLHFSTKYFMSFHASSNFCNCLFYTFSSTAIVEEIVHFTTPSEIFGSLLERHQATILSKKSPNSPNCFTIKHTASAGKWFYKNFYCHIKCQSLQNITQLTICV